MADPKGVPEEVGVAPEGPGGTDDIQSQPNPEGPSKVYAVPEVSIDVTTVNLVMALLYRKLLKYQNDAAASAVVWEIKNEISNW